VLENRHQKRGSINLVFIVIEGAHVFNSGLGEYGAPPVEADILANIKVVKAWDYVPLFIGLAHNFNNDLCGHARSLQRLGKLVNQEYNLDTGISPLGHNVIQALLDETDGRSIYIDLKHMSLASRLEYYDLLNTEYASRNIPIIVSHGAVTGCSIKGSKRPSGCLDIFNTNDINFFDEEIIAIARSEGFLAIQMDRMINADLGKVKISLKGSNMETPIRQSAVIIWNQLQHIAEVCDEGGLFAWGSTAIGSDFDGSIAPFPGILTATCLEALSKELIGLT
jgi:microsomal dipeptidase-like Zn-dependent dipeptidase